MSDESKQAGIFLRRNEGFERRGMSRRNASLAVSAARRGDWFGMEAPTQRLRDIGLEGLPDQSMGSAAALQSAPAHGFFRTYPSLGMLAIFGADSTTEDAARDALDDDYVYVPDFKLGLPPTDRAFGVTRLRSDAVGREWPHESGVPLAHQQRIRGSGVLIGVLDTGIDADHDEFKDRIIPYRYTPMIPNFGNQILPRDIRGFDPDSHGTHVSAIAAGNDVGVAPEADLHVASVIESETILTSMTRLIRGIAWITEVFAAPEKVNLPAVLSLSLGFKSTNSKVEDDRRRVIRQALQALEDLNILVIAAIGNDGPGSCCFPADLPGVLSVGAVDFDHRVWSGSGSSGKGKPEVLGYGVEVLSATHRDYAGRSVYQRMTGTSMATPYVTGVAALFRSIYPKESVANIRMRLIDSADTSLNFGGGTSAGLARFVPRSSKITSIPKSKVSRGRRKPR